jgi:hypothetical protein
MPFRPPATLKDGRTTRRDHGAVRPHGLENLDLVADPDRNFKIIMKDGRIFKDTSAK